MSSIYDKNLSTEMLGCKKNLPLMYSSFLKVHNPFLELYSNTPHRTFKN